MRTNVMSLDKQIAERHSNKPEAEKEDSKLLIPTGSTLLNLACSDSRRGAFGAGKIINIIGDSHSGKTAIALSVLAEACYNSKFDNYKLVYDDAEAANSFDIPELFGFALAERMQAPAKDREGDPLHSETIEDFQIFIHKLLNANKPFIYVLDSLDSLTSVEDASNVEEKIKAHKAGRKAKGSYSMSKPKMMSEILRQIRKKLRDTDSTLIIVSQTRDNINPMSFTPKVRSGGKALEFYASHVLWTAPAGKIKKTDQVIGVRCSVKSTKSKLTGKSRTVIFPIYYDYGIDDIGSNLDFLKEMKRESLIASKLGIQAKSREKTIQLIEDRKKAGKLSRIVETVWKDREEKLKLHRRKKYQ